MRGYQPDTAVARVVQAWNDSLARRLGPERDGGQTERCHRPADQPLPAAASRCWATW